MSDAIDPVARARAYLAGVLDNPNAKPADKLRAAEAILREGVTLPAGRGVARGMSDAELEAAARGEGGTPPERGPVTGLPQTGPIREGTEQPGSNPTAARPTDLQLPPTPGAISRRARRGPRGGTPAGVTPAGGLARAARSGEDVDPLS